MAATLLKSLCKKSYKKKPLKPLPIRTTHQGMHYHLKEIYDEVNREYFNSSTNLLITWSGSAIRGARRCRRLGCFVPPKKLIRISKILDDPQIPYYFISFIVYHEILHHLFPPLKRGRGKRVIHHEEFKNHEKKFKDYALAREWEKVIGKKKFFLE